MLEPTALIRSPVIALAAFGLVLAACQREPEKTPPPPAAPKVEAPPAPPAPPPALSRVQLLRAMETAAHDYAAGEAPANDGLAGRRFAVRQAFGCFAPSPVQEPTPDGLARWSWRADNTAIELSLTPGDWTKSALVDGAAEEWEAVEGIWLVRPWLLSGDCPGVRSDPLASGPPAASPQTMGIAVVHAADGSRLERRMGRAYSFVVRGKDGEPPPAPENGYRLVLEGRLTAFADGRSVHCRAANPDQRPVCVAAARVDRVAFEDASGAVLSEWRAG